MEDIFNDKNLRPAKKNCRDTAKLNNKENDQSESLEIKKHELKEFTKKTHGLCELKRECRQIMKNKARDSREKQANTGNADKSWRTHSSETGESWAQYKLWTPWQQWPLKPEWRVTCEDPLSNPNTHNKDHYKDLKFFMKTSQISR